MKKFFSFIAGTLLLASCGNSATEEACVKIYADGIKEVNVAKSHKELSDISFKVNTQIMEIANGPAGDEKLSVKESEALNQAQQDFFRAIERRGRQLMPQPQ